MTYRVGIGYDIHRLESGAGIAVAGVHVPCAFRVVAHSDGDVVLHALCDALLGAVAAGDLGEHFPDNDPQHAGRDSADFVEQVLALETLQPWRIANLDVNVIAQEPRLGPHKGAMRIRLAQLFGLPLDRVGLKARTNEGCDAIGERRAIAAQAVVLLEPKGGTQRGTLALARRRRSSRETETGTARLAPKPPMKRRARKRIADRE